MRSAFRPRRRFDVIDPPPAEPTPTVSRFVTAAGILVTFVAWTGTVLDERAFVTGAIRRGDALALAGAVVHLVLVSVLIYGSLVYLFSRWGYLTRLAGHG